MSRTNFIAQEYREVFPDSVQDDGTGLLQVDTYNATPYVVKAVQELSEQNEKQQSEIEQLRTENKSMREEVQTIKELKVENEVMREEIKTLQQTVKRLIAS